MVKRDLEIQLQDVAKYFSAIAVLGPRQSGKTTLVQQVFAQHAYVSLEDLDVREQARTDPRGFLQQWPTAQGIILDEIQHVPELLSYMQTIIDREKKLGFFVITGSQNILVNTAVTQTLAGRIAILTLFPFSINELNQAGLLPEKIEEAVFKGSYPRLYAQDGLLPDKFYPHYIRGYIERDVRELKNIFDLSLFQKFVQLCAGRTGQLLNLASLGNDCGIDQKTARAWLSVLEATYVVFLLQPYYKNFGKRLIKTPKLYFVDTGIACSLLGIKSVDELSQHYLRGGLVESFIITDLLKQYYARNERPTLYFWRDHMGNEIDCFLEQALRIVPIEIKSGYTVGSDYFKQFVYLKTVQEFPATQNFVVYAGDQNMRWPEAQVLGWKSVGTLVQQVENER